MPAILKLLSGRLARNILFWIALLLVFGLQQAAVHDRHGVNALFRVAYVVGFGLPIYLNNLWFIPAFLYQRKRSFWFLVSGLWIVGTLWVQQLYRWLELLFPEDYQYFAPSSNDFVSQLLHLGILMILFSMAKFSTDSFVRQRKLEDLQREKLQSELESLRNQIDPHFLFNALNTIYSLSRHMNPKTPKAVADLASILRYVIYESQAERILLEQEIDFVRDYLEFMKLRKEASMDISLEVLGDPGNREIAPLILLPLIENAFKHGIDQSTGHCRMKIVLRIEEHHIRFECTNTKPAQVKEPSSQRGLGLDNVRRRLKLIYGTSAELNIADDQNEFKVWLNVQV